MEESTDRPLIGAGQDIIFCLGFAVMTTEIFWV